MQKVLHDPVVLLRRFAVRLTTWSCRCVQLPDCAVDIEAEYAHTIIHIDHVARTWAKAAATSSANTVTLNSVRAILGVLNKEEASNTSVVINRLTESFNYF
jgi:hypothetical protein